MTAPAPFYMVFLLTQECCYKVCKSLLKPGKEFQPVNYNTTVSNTALVFARFIILELLTISNFALE